MIYRNLISRQASKFQIRITVFLSFLIFFLLTSCSKVELKDSTREALPQYLEELKISETDQESRYAALMELHNLEPETYRIGSGNKFDIKIYAYGEEESAYLTHDAIVKSDGTITVSYIDEDIYVLGMTIPEAKQEIKKYIKDIIDPKVTLNPLELKSASVTIMGQAEDPGNYPIKAGMRILEALAEANGFRIGLVKGTDKEMADLSGSFVVRDNKILPVDFLELVRKGNQLHNIPLRDEDYIFIASLANQEVYVIGEVMSPNAHLYKENMTLIQLIAFANGFTDNAQGKVYLIRGSLSHPRLFIIDTDAILRGDSRDIIIKPNDIVYVPKTLLADWNTIVSQIIPSIQAIQSAYILNNAIEDLTD